MVMLSPKRHGAPQPPVSPAELAAWHEIIKQMPPTRTSKVDAARQAIADQTFETLDHWDETIQRLARALDMPETGFGRRL